MSLPKVGSVAPAFSTIDDTGARGVAEAAVMVSDPAFEHFGQVLPDDLFLLLGKNQRVGIRQVPRQISRLV